MPKSNLHVAVFPSVGREEMADCNWFEWLIVGHEDPSKIGHDDLNWHVREFFATAYDDNDDEQTANRKFLDYMNAQDYTVFEPGWLHWAVNY